MTNPRTQSRAAETTSASPAGPAVHVVTFGCQMNKYDSLLVEGRFQRRGYRVAPSMEDADVVLFNTCSVREHAEERAISWVGELKRVKAARPELVVGVMGCYAQRAEEEILQRAAHVDVVCGTRRFQHLPELVDEVRRRRADPDVRRRDERLVDTGMDDAVEVGREAEPYTGGLAGYLAVMRGCDLSCSFCIVPTTRGRVQSRPVPALVDEARWMVDQGCRAITLLGQTVNSYGEDLEPAGMLGRRGRPSLADLIRELQEVDGLERIRLITLAPAYVNRALAEAIRDCDKAERFLPLPAQSGSDRVLKGMRRGYSSELYRKKVELLREVVPDLELGSDWIVGFPTEGEEDFQKTEALLADVGYAQGYVFKYDPRPGTQAADLEDDVDTATKKERNQRLLRAVERSGLRRHEAHIGQLRRVFVEEVWEKDAAIVRGRTEHGLSCSLKGGEELIGTTQSVRVLEASPFGLAGELEVAGD